MNKAALIVILLAGNFSPGRAVDPQPVAKIPPAASWEVFPAPRGFDAALRDAPDPDPNSPSRVTITRSGRVQKVEIAYAAGPGRTVWLTGGEIHSEQDNLISSGRMDGWSPELYSMSESWMGTEWVTPSTFIGRTTFGGLPADLYETKAPQGQELQVAKMMGVDPTALATLRRAWIDPETRRPLGVLTPGGLFVYRYLSPPQGDLQLPDRFRAKQRERDEEVARQQAEAATR